MKRSLLAIAAASALALVLAGGTFFALKLTASGATTGAVAVASYPGNPPSGVAGGGGATDCDNIVCPIPFTAGSAQVVGISAWNAPAMKPPAYVMFTYYNAKNCNPAANVALLVTDPLGPTAADARLQNGVPKTGLLITPANTPYMGGAGPLLSVGVTVAAGAFQCGNDLDDDADGAINDGCSTVVVAEAVCNETEAACADADGQRPWDACDDDGDGGINDGCPIVGIKEAVNIPDAANYQFLACGNVDGLPVTGWTGRLTANWKLIPFSFAIDADPWNGTAPCTPVDATHTVDVGAKHEVAVCTVSEPQKPAGGPDDVAAFSFNLTYDPLLNTCTPKACSKKSPCTEDDNPDANAGATLGSGYPSFTQCTGAVDDDSDGFVNDGCPQLGAAESVCTGAVDEDADTLINDGCQAEIAGEDPDIAVAELTGGLGSGWDCSGGGLIEPTCTAGTAVMACMSVAGPYTSSALSPFPLAIVKFTAIDDGTDTIVTNTNVWKGVVVVEQHPPSISGIVYKEPPPPATPTPTNTPVPPTATPTPTKTPSALGEGVFMWKDANVLTDPAEDPANVETVNNLWLMDPALGCPDAARGKGCLLVNKWVFQACDGISPNTGAIEGVGAWEEQIKYDHKIVRLTPVPNNTWLSNNGARWVSCSMTILTENWILTGCVTADFDPSDPQPGPGVVCDGTANGLIETIKVVPMTDDLMYRQGFRPGKDNGVVTDLVDENCELSNTLGEKLPAELPGGLTTECGDVHITVRMLEGDIDLDCNVDVVDEQGIAFRYGTFFGLTLYDEWYDLAPECQDYACDTDADTVYDEVCRACYGVPDFDIDIKDLQFVFGRDGSTCVDPIPADQVPVDPPQP